MLIFRHLEEIPESFGPTVVSIGNFDGVHCAHAKVLRSVVQRARELGCKAVAFTFEPHPTRILRPDVAPKLITPADQKLRLLERQGLDAVLMLPFSRDLSVIPARDFAQHILFEKLKVRQIHEGFNFHFGHKAEGTVETLRNFGREFGFEVVVYQELDIRGEMVSSSRIRELIISGAVARARHLLGRVFSIAGTPGRGRGYGHKYTVPTMNLSRYDELVPRHGVYITRTRVGEEWFDSVTNVGTRPTFEHESFAIETHLLNFHPVDVFVDTEVEIQFLGWIRPEIKWESVDALRAQIAKDVHRARRYFRLVRRVSAGQRAGP